ncbi:MAG TPA: matrixin family metalloprotease [Terriglobia bacterium]|nr:matrixin family metalloprotease [Terriglobia bacterium]
MRNRILVSGVILGAVLSAVVVAAYTLQQDIVGTKVGILRWAPASGQPTFTWQINPTIDPNKVDTSGGSVDTALQNAFAAWTTAQVKLQGSLQSITTFTVTEGSQSTLQNTAIDCNNVISFEPTTVNFATGIVAETFVGSVMSPPNPSPPYVYNNCTGGKTVNVSLTTQIVDADMVFNTGAYCFSTAQSPPASLAACPNGPVYDLQAIATHEVGHMLGLDHSGLAHATMFPFGDSGTTAQRSLGVDDAVGEAFLYPSGSFATATGTVAGTVTLSGGPAFASHVVLLDQQTGIAVTDGLTAADGTYALNGVPPGTYNLVILSLHGVYTIDNFSLWACGYAVSCTGSPALNYSGTFF